MDKLRCAKLVLDALYLYSNEIMNLMSVSICSILTQSMSKSETTHLGSDPKYILSLLEIVIDKLFTETVDFTLMFTLDVLWNLTDESPGTCYVFIDKNGLHIYMDVLKTFRCVSNIEINVLGLINNIAEVPHLRAMLFHDDVFPTIRQLMWSKQFDVSYFAAGIFAHLACEPEWKTYTVYDKAEVLEDLGCIVRQWVLPELEIVSYKSFLPLIGLLNSTDLPQVQLWAAWAIHYVCTKDAEKYFTMLEKENGVIILQTISSDKSVDHELSELCYRILEQMNTFRNGTDSAISKEII